MWNEQVLCECAHAAMMPLFIPYSRVFVSSVCAHDSQHALRAYRNYKKRDPFGEGA